MIKDEFNQIEVTNDKQLLRSEFGKTQKVEFSSQNENKLPEGDLNEKYIGKTIRKETEVNVDYINKVPTHGAQTVVTSTGTATTAAAATAGTAVAASTVAVVAIATVTGISVAIHDYKYEFKSLIISSNELRYELYVYDAALKEDEYLSFEDEEASQQEETSEFSSAPFKLRVYNNDYDASQYLWDRSTNIGVFSNLSLGATYNIVLSENRYGGEEIYKDTFVTYVNSSIVDFTLYPYTDYVEGTFDYNLDFVDDDDSISDITLEFYPVDLPRETVASFAIPKESGYKTISALDDNGGQLVDLNSEWGYRVSYTQNNEKKTFKEDKIAFEDYAGRKSAFNDFIFDKTANFIDNSITVTIDYIDRLGWYSDFKLKLTQVPVDNQTGTGGQDDYYSQEINLASTNEPQTIVLNEYEMYVRDANFKYTYSLSCLYQGELTVLKEETEPFSFSDISGGKSEFNSLIFDKKADFVNNTFKVRLDYVDDFNSFYSFTLHLFPQGVNAQYDFYLDPTTEEQTCTFDENQHWNFSFDYTYTYNLTYYDDYGQVTYGENSESFVFTDEQNRVSECNGVTFTGEYDITTGKAPVQLNYQDDFGYLSDFVLRFYGPITSQGGTNPLIHYADSSGTSPSIDEYQYSVDLVKTTEVQYINLYESGVPISAEGQFMYALTYNRKGVQQTPIQPETKFYFDDPDALSEVRGITFVNGEANFNERSFVVQLDFDDDYGYFNNFELQVWDDDNGGWVERSLSKTTDPQTVVIDEFDEEDYKYPVDIVEGDLTYNLVYTSAETGDPATQYFFDNPQPLSFTNSLKSEFYGLETSYDFRREEPAGEARLPFRFNCVNDAEYFSAPELYITTVGNDEEILASIMFANEVMDDSWQYGSFSTSDPDFNLDLLTNGYEYNVMVAYQAKDGYNGPEQRITFSAGIHVFTLNEKQEIYHVGVENYLAAGNWEVYTTVFANGAFDDFSNGEIIFQRADGNYAALAYDVTISEYMTVDLHSPKEYTVNEDDLQEYFSHPVNITFKYSKPGSNEIITLNCYSNYLFSISN